MSVGKPPICNINTPQEAYDLLAAALHLETGRACLNGSVHSFTELDLLPAQVLVPLANQFLQTYRNRYFK